MILPVIYRLFSLLYKIWRSFKSKLYIASTRCLYKQNDGFIVRPHQIVGEKNIVIGRNTIFAEGAIITAWNYRGKQKFEPEIIIGSNCVFGEHIQISCCRKIQIGDNVLTGRYVYISDNSHGETDLSSLLIPPSKRPLSIKGEICIGDDVWIGERACILSGVKIGTGSVIAANAVVTHDIPSYCVAAGIPAKIIKKLSFD